MKTRLMRFLPLLLALATLIALAWLGGSMLLSPPAPVVQSLEPDLSGRLRRFGTYPRMARAYELIDQGKLDEAADWLESVLQQDPGNLPALEQLAELRLRQGEAGKAVAAAEQAVDRRPELPALTWLLARAHAAAGDYGGALAAVDQALGQGMWTTGLKDPERQQAQRARVGYLLELGRAEAAREALAALPDAPAEDLVRLGDLFYREKSLEHAQQAFAMAEARAAQQGQPEVRDQAAARLAQAALSAGDDAAAERAYRAIVERQPDDREALAALANLAQSAGRPAAAARWLERWIAAGGTATVADRQRLARLHLESGDAAAALRTLRKIPDAALGRDGRLLEARIALAAGENAKAAELFEAAATAEPGAPDLADLRSAAEALREAGDVERELTLRRRIAALSGLDSDRLALVDRLVAEDRFDAAADQLDTMVRDGDEGALKRLLAVLLAGGRAKQGVAMLERQGHPLEAAELAAASRDWAAAARLFLDAFRSGGGRDPDLLTRAVYAAQQAGGAASEIAVLRAAMPFSDLSARHRRAFALQLVQLLDGAGQEAAALETLTRMAQALDDPELALDLATRLSGNGQCRPALAWARRAMAAADPPPRLYALAGLCAASLGQTDLAVGELRRAIASADASGTLPDIAWLNALGYAEEAERRPAMAARVWQRSLTRRFDPQIALAAAVALRAAGAPADADRWLARIDPADLAPDRHALYLDQMALAAAEAGDPDVAMLLLREAIDLQPSADRWFRLGGLESRAGDPAAALSAYRQAAVLAPDNANIQASIGYALVNQGEDEAAAGHFDRAIALDPQLPVAVYEDSGYAEKRLARNDAAVARFRQAIERTPQEGAEDLEKRFRLRREVEQIENRWTVTANVTVNTLQAATGPPSPVRETANGTGAVEAAWQPPVIGYRDGRTVQLFSRMYWNAEDRSIVPQRDSIQAGIGARWKPLTDYNLVLSFERLIAVGAFAYDDWLARVSLGFGQNLDWQPVRTDWPTGSLYLDAARVLGEQATFLTAIGRWGHAWKKPFGIGLPDAADAITGYGLATASQSTDDTVSTGRVEVGAGLSYKLWYNDTADEAYRSTAEIGLETRYLFQNNAADSASLQLRLQFRL